jgi:capsular exopolysaccharide synthesis family protein
MGVARGKQEMMSQIDFDRSEDSEGGSGQMALRTRLFIRELLARWHWVVLGLILGLLGGFYYLSKAPKTYQATASLLVKQGASTLMKSGQQEEDFDLTSSEALNTVAERVKRPELLTKVASRPEVLALEDLIPSEPNWFPAWSHDWLGKNDAPPLKATDLDSPVLGQLIGSWTTVSVRRNTRLLDITVEHPSPEIASLLADAIATEYPNELGSTRAAGRNDSSEALGDQVEAAEKALLKKQNALANYKIILESLRKLEDKETFFSEMDRRYLDLHPKWIDAKASVDEYRKRFLAEFDQVRRASVDKDYWEENRNEWSGDEFDENARLQNARRLLTAREDVLKSSIISLNENFNELSKTRLEVEANKAITEAEVELNSPSLIPKSPSSPRRMFALAAGSILGFGSGFALAFLLVKLDNKVHTVVQAEFLTGLPVLATIRDIQPKVLAKIISQKGGTHDSLSPAARKWDSRIVLRPGLSESLYAEMFRILRASVTLLGDEKKRSVTLFSSALPGEGKTLVSANFAITSAQQGKKTLLLDLDLRKPAVHKVFGLKRKDLTAGVTEVLAQKTTWREALSTDIGEENLSCLFAGAKAPNPGRLLNPDFIVDLLAELKEEFDVIVVDSAPLLAVPDPRLLIPTVDNFCLVLRAEQTPKGVIQRTLELLEDDGTEPDGVIVNGYEEKAGFLARKYRYGYGYGGYGQYGKGYGSYGTYGSDEDDD